MNGRKSILDEILAELVRPLVTDDVRNSVSTYESTLCGCGTCGGVLNLACEEVIKNYNEDKDCLKWTRVKLLLLMTLYDNIEVTLMESNGMNRDAAIAELKRDNDEWEKRAEAILEQNAEYTLAQINGPIKEAFLANYARRKDRRDAGK